MAKKAPPTGKAPKTIHVVSYTHWDREFRFDFETTRMRLVDLMDHMLEIMRTRPDFKNFMLDGQFVLLDDYLEIRPEAEKELRRLAAKGRLEIGPWYTLPDSSCVHGESLIRNLMTGLRKSRDFGGTMTVGYNVFSFGQIAQLPQVYAGFGIDFILFYKNMDPGRSRYPEFIWEAPDGSRALATRLGREARWNFTFGGHIPIVYDQDPWDRAWRYNWGTLGKVFHMCEPDTYTSFHDILDPETSFHRKNVRAGFERTLKAVEGTRVPEHLLFFDGTDFTEPHPCTPDILAAAREEFADEYNIVHSRLADYVAGARQSLEKQELEVVRGDMRDGPVGSVHTDVCSIHPELKRASGKAENLLYRWAEPFSAIAWTLGADYPATHFARALRMLFTAQAHDSLHGIGPGDMAAGIEGRFLQARLIAEGTAVRALGSVATHINTAAAAEDTNVFLVVYNPSSFPRTEVVEAYIDVPNEGIADLLILEEADGTPVFMHELERTDARAGLYHPRSRNMPIYATRFHVLAEVRDVLALGYKVIKVKRKDKAIYPYPHEGWDPIRIPYDHLGRGTHEAENEKVRLTIAPDGSLTITDKATGHTAAGLNAFIDSGEQGNLDVFSPPALNRIETTAGSPARISVLVDSPLMARFRIEKAMRLPDRFDAATGRRSATETDVPVSSVITLRRGSAAVEIETTVDNKVRDHFLRATFPTGIKAAHAHAEGSFEVNAYPTRVSRKGDLCGPELTRHRQHLFVDLSDAKRGFAILNDAVRDYEVIDADSGTIALSLVRGVVLKIPCDNRFWKEYPGDDSAQSLGKHKIRYALLPHAGDWDTGQVYEAALAFNTPLRLAQVGRHKGTLPLAHSFLEVRGKGMVLSALKKAEDRNTLVVRLFNPTTKTVQAELVTARPATRAWMVNLNEDRGEKIEIGAAGSVSLAVAPKKIVSVEIVLKR